MKKRATSKLKKRLTAVHTDGSLVRFKVVVEEKAIRKRVRELAKQINRDYAGKSLQVVGILEDGFVFMADLIRALTVPVACSFVRLQVRDSKPGLVAMREILYIPPVDAAGKNILIIDGILESGLTVDHLCRTLLAQRPASLRTAVLIDKVAERKVEVPVDYAGFQLSGRFWVGYGLGFEGQFRNLPFLARVAE
jgi:hypoxanthine phosphoribosyltransferase